MKATNYPEVVCSAVLVTTKINTTGTYFSNK
jgi:hypothetical protein